MTQEYSDSDYRSRQIEATFRSAFRINALAAALAAAGVLALGSAQATVIFDTTHEPTNDTLAGATLGAVGDTFTGCVGRACDSVHPTGVDPADFVNFGGLIPGDTYQASLSIGGGFANTVVFDLHDNGHVAIDLTRMLSSAQNSVSVPGLTGLSSLVIGISIIPGPNFGGCCEGYTVSLQQTGGSAVPEPATVVLVAAGLISAFVGRRRKRS
jgi:hypothetical protein